MEAELRVLARDWRWLFDGDRYRLLAISPFGDLLLQDDTDAISLLDINFGELNAATVEGISPAVLFPFAFDDVIAARYRDAGLFLTEGKCYGYKVQLVTRGLLAPKNVYVATLIEYVSFMGCFHHQIKDVCDGETVRVKVINQKVIH